VPSRGACLAPEDTHRTPRLLRHGKSHPQHPLHAKCALHADWQAGISCSAILQPQISEQSYTEILAVCKFRENSPQFE